MDFVYAKYANPMELMRIYIEQGRFGEWVAETLELERRKREAEAEKREADELMQFYLHRIFDKSYKEFIDGLQAGMASPEPVDFEQCITDSMKILNGFSPEQEVRQDGAI